jgi:NIMA (never in mitosis gene a)-related kinase 1/4/5
MSTSTLNDFNILSTLGSGSYGQVYKVERIVHKHAAATNKSSKKKTSKIYVMKQVQLNQMTKEEQFDAVNECKIMASLSNKYIVKYYDSFIDKTALNIIMEYCNNGDLQQYLSHAKRKANTYNTDKFSSNSHGKNINSNYQNNVLLPENIIWKFLIEMANGLYYLHSQKILHRDMKTANIFLLVRDDAGNTQAHCNKFGQHYNNVPSLKIGDLGVAKMLNSTKSYAASVVGTPYYLSPELCANKPYNKQSDVWALGCILYECCKYILCISNLCSLIFARY